MHAQNLIDKETIERELRKLELPDFIRAVRIETGVDSSGDDAVWVWLAVTEGAMSNLENKRIIKEIREQVYRVFSEKASGILPYIRLENPKHN